MFNLGIKDSSSLLSKNQQFHSFHNGREYYIGCNSGAGTGCFLLSFCPCLVHVHSLLCCEKAFASHFVCHLNLLCFGNFSAGCSTARALCRKWPFPYVGIYPGLYSVIVFLRNDLVLAERILLKLLSLRLSSSWQLRALILYIPYMISVLSRKYARVILHYALYLCISNFGAAFSHFSWHTCRAVPRATLTFVQIIW